jgi:uncharacterized protein YndB with AHSA1/START domain
MKHIINKTIDLKAPIERVWKALSDHEEFGAWFRVRLDGPFVVGQTTTGTITHPGCEHMLWFSKVERMDAPHLLVFHWPHAEDPASAEDARTAPTTRVEFRLEEIPTGTRLTVTESGFEALPEDRRATVMRQNDGGWQEQMTNVKNHVEV